MLRRSTEAQRSGAENGTRGAGGQAGIRCLSRRCTSASKFCSVRTTTLPLGSARAVPAARHATSAARTARAVSAMTRSVSNCTAL